MHKAGIGLLGWDGENTSTVFEQSRYAISIKRMNDFNGDQSSIARVGAVVALGLQRVEELHDQWRIELPERADGVVCNRLLANWNRS